MCDAIIRTGRLPESQHPWHRKPYTRKEFDGLGIIKPGMSIGEVRRRIRAVTYKHWGPRIEIDGVLFKLEGV